MYSTHRNTSNQNMGLDSRGRPMPRRTSGAGRGQLAKPAKPASEKQLDFLTKLAAELAELVQIPEVPTPEETDAIRNARIVTTLVADHLQELTLDAASGLIEVALATIKEARRTASRAAVVEVTDGIYYFEGQVVKVQRAVHGSGQLYAKLLVVEDGQGSWEYTPGLVRKLRPEHKMTVAQAAEFGKLYGVCCVCGATLTNETSIELGIGPVCRTRLS